MQHLAIIPARAGSKGVIDKNIQEIGGKTLLDWAVDSALESNIFSAVLITTDIPQVIAKYENDVRVLVTKRSPLLCHDTAEMTYVVRDVLTKADLINGDYFWLLQPTTPFRTKNNFLDIMNLLKDKNPASVISVKQLISAHPNRTYTIYNGKLNPYRHTNFENRQKLKKMYIRNGGFYVFKGADFLREDTFFIKDCLPYVMDEFSSINIDSNLDLLMARAAYDSD